MYRARGRRPSLRQPTYTDPPPGVMAGPPFGQAQLTIICHKCDAPWQLPVYNFATSLGGNLTARDGQPGAPPLPPARLPLTAAGADRRNPL